MTLWSAQVYVYIPPEFADLRTLVCVSTDAHEMCVQFYWTSHL